MTRTLVSETLHNRVALRAVENEWWVLWRRVPSATPFQAPAWLLSWWDAFSPGTLCVVTVRENGRLVGLAPFYVEEGIRGGHVLPIGISVSDYLDILVCPDLAAEGATAIAGSMAEQRWDCWELPDLAAGAIGWRVPRPPGYDEARDCSGICSILALPPSVAELAAVIPAGRRRKIRQARNRAARGGGFEIVGTDRFTSHALFSALVRLHALRWTSRGMPGVLADDRVVSFHRAAMPGLLATGMLRLYGLRFAGRLIAAYYGFHHAGRAYAYLTGFDPAFSSISPGTLLIAHAIEQAVRDGASEIDFLRGDETFKERWGVIRRRNGRRVFRRAADHAPA